MTINYARLRALAEAALNEDPNTPRRAVDAFISDAEEAFDNAIDPPTLIALLDRLEAAEKRAAEYAAVVEKALAVANDSDQGDSFLPTIVALESAPAVAPADAARRRDVEQERDQLAAVVEKARKADRADTTWGVYGECVSRILREAPADVLREHDAALIEGLADEADYSLVHHKEAVALLRREARQRREERA